MHGTEALAEIIRELLAQQHLGVLATNADGAPHPSLVGFKALKDMRGLLFVTGRATRKFGNLKRDNRASMLIDNRSHRAADFRLAMALTAQGRVKEIDTKTHMAMMAAYIDRFPHLEEFARSPGCALMSLQVERYSLVRRFQDVVELIF